MNSTEECLKWLWLPPAYAACIIAKASEIDDEIEEGIIDAVEFTEDIAEATAETVTDILNGENIVESAQENFSDIG